MEIATLYLGKYHTLLAVLEKSSAGYKLLYIKRLDNILDLNAITDGSSIEAINEINEILSHFKINHFVATLNPTYYITTQVPGNFNNNKIDFIKLVNLAIKQHYSDKSIDDFRIKSIKMYPPKFNYDIELVTIINKDIILSLESVVAMFGCELTDINPSHISAINAYNFNYPDNKNCISILAEQLDNIFEFGIISDNKVLGYEYCVIEEGKPISTFIENKLEQIISDYNSLNINCIYFYGEQLTKKEYLECWEIGMIVSGDSKRLNPFRYIQTDLEQRDKDYCAKTFQMYVNCIGGALSNSLDIIVY